MVLSVFVDLCGPYRRNWVLLKRLHSVIDGAKVRGVAHLDDRIYVVYSNQDRIGVYMDETPYSSLDCIRIAEMRCVVQIRFECSIIDNSDNRPGP
jgi:hypothetical protein